jgi:hypothetical protein
MRVVLSLWVALGLWFASAVRAQEPVAAVLTDSTVTVEFRDTTVSSYDLIYTMAVYITSPAVPLAGIQLRLVADRPDLVELPDSAVYFPLVDFGGSAIAGWDYKNYNRLTPQVLNIAGIHNLPGGITPSPLAPSSTPYRIARFAMKRVAPLSVLDTLQDRSVTWLAVLASCSFSDPNGKLIGIRDTVYCANPPVCSDTVRESYDANTYLSGTLTLGPPCGPRGDVNESGTINSADIIFLVNHVFKAGPQPACSGISGDVDCSGAITAADIIYLVNFVFKAGSAPCG